MKLWETKRDPKWWKKHLEDGAYQGACMASKTQGKWRQLSTP